MNKIKVEVAKIPEKEYMEFLMETLKEIPKDVFVMLGLKRKTGNFEDDFEAAPVFAFRNKAGFDFEDIMEYAETLSMESFVLPGLKMSFVLATGPEEEFDLLMKLPEDAILYDEFRTIVKKYKEFYKKAA